MKQLHAYWEARRRAEGVAPGSRYGNLTSHTPYVTRASYTPDSAPEPCGSKDSRGLGFRARFRGRLGPNYHNLSRVWGLGNGIWDLRPKYLGPGTLKVGHT